MGHSAVVLARFRSSLARLQRDRTFFLNVRAQLEQHPRYLEALEWASADGFASPSVAYAPCQLAVEIGLAYFLATPVAERPARFYIPASDALKACIDEWEGPKQDEEGPVPNPQTMWEIARRVMIEQEPDTVREIERTVRRSGFESRDQSLALFSLGLFFLLVARSHASVQEGIETITRPPSIAVKSAHHGSS